MNISVIFTGGTIGSLDLGSSIGTSDDAPRLLLSLYRAKSGDNTVFDTAAPYTILSEELSFSHISQLTDAIRAKMLGADGIIVTHGTDTLPFTAAALSYALGLCRVPVVLVSANYVLTDKRSNGVQNLAAAVAFLRQARGARGVFVSYQNKGEPTKIHRASRLLMHQPPTDEVRSLDGVVATYENGKITPVAAYNEKADGTSPFAADMLPRAEGRVLWLHAHPGAIYPLPTDETAAILLEGYHSGTLPVSSPALRALCKKAKALGVPVFLTGTTGEKCYGSTESYPVLGITPLPRLSPVAAYMKLCYAIGCGTEDLTATLETPLGGDL